MLALGFRDPGKLAERVGLAEGDVAFARRVGRDRLPRYALVHQGRLLGVLRMASLLKLVLIGRLSLQSAVMEGVSDLTLPLLEEYPAAVVIQQRGGAPALDSPTHWVGRVPLSGGTEATVLLRRPRLIDVRYVVLELLQKPLVQPFLHNRVSHTLQNLPGRRHGGTPPLPSIQSGSGRFVRQNMIYVKLDDVTLRRSSEHICAIADTGLHVNVGLFLFDLEVDDLPRRMTDHPRITVSVHSGGWKHSFWASVLDPEPLTPPRLAAAENYQRSFFTQLSLLPSLLANLHFYALQREAIPYLLRSGQTASIMYAEVCSNGSSVPRRGRKAASYALGRTENGLLLVSAEDHSGWRYDTHNTWDVLKRTSHPSGRGDVARGTDRIFRAARNAFDLGMPAILSTHEFRLTRFRPDEVSEMFSSALDRLREAGYEPSCVSETEFTASLNKDLDNAE